MKNCFICRKKATQKCQCIGEYFCDTDVVSHLRTKGPHNLTPVLNELDPCEQRAFEAKIFYRLNLINCCKNDIMIQAARLINQIE